MLSRSPKTKQRKNTRKIDGETWILFDTYGSKDKVTKKAKDLKDAYKRKGRILHARILKKIGGYALYVNRGSYIDLDKKRHI